MFRTMVVAVSAMALFAVGCGGTQEPSEPTGSLSVKVLGLTSEGSDFEDVTAVRVFLDGDVDYAIDLTKNAENEWVGTFEKVYRGRYTALAKAFDAENEVIFLSEPTDFNVLAEDTEELLLVLNQLDNEASLVAPYFLSIHLDKTALDQGETVTITVRAGGAEGAELLLAGRHAYQAPNERNGVFGADAAFQNGEAVITWTAPFFQGPIWFVLQVNDTTNQATAEMGVVVLVGAPRDDFGVKAAFNMAPTLELETRYLVDAFGLELWAFVTATDDDEMTFTWTGTCSGGRITDGDDLFEGSKTNLHRKYFKYYISREDLGEPDADASCDFVLRAKDTDLAETTVTVTLDPELIVANDDIAVVWDLPYLVDANEALEVSGELALIDSFSFEGMVRLRFSLFDLAAGTTVPDFGKGHAFDLHRPTDGDYTDAPTLTTDENGYVYVGPETGVTVDQIRAASPGPYYFEMIGLNPGRYIIMTELVSVEDGALLAGHDHWFEAAASTD